MSTKVPGDVGSPVDTPLRVAYVFTFDLSRARGLLPRLDERLRLWADEGVAATVIVCVSRGSDLEDIVLPKPHRLVLVRDRSSVLATSQLPRALAAANPDVVYMRYTLPYPGCVSVARTWPTILEIHADDLAEYSGAKLAMTRLLRSRLLSRAAGFVHVDPDLLGAPSFASFEPGRKVTSITNGIDVSRIVVRRERGVRDLAVLPPRALLILGADQPWQGLAKFFALAAEIPDVHFDVVGPAGEQAGAAAPSSNVTLHGARSGVHLAERLKTADVGVGNLSLELINRPRASPLKVREYIAWRLPLVLAHDDPDLTFDDPSMLRLPYGFDVTPAIADRFRSFCWEWAGRPCSQRLLEAVDLASKERSRCAFMRQVAAG